MQLRENLWLEGGYYIDFDEREQLRIVGPQNHLHFGGVGFYRGDIGSIDVEAEAGQGVRVNLAFPTSKLLLRDPAMGHIRKVRQYTEFLHQAPTLFSDVAKRHSTVLEPNYIQSANNTIVYRRLYGEQWYGVKIEAMGDVTIIRNDRKRGFELSGAEPIRLTITAESSHPVEPSLPGVLRETSPVLSPNLRKLWDQAGHEINHLIPYSKTSGYAYGTVFPRDWMESADLGNGDITDEAWRYMYQQSLRHVTSEGVGWHEDMVGEYQFEEQDRLGQTERSLDELVAEATAIKDRMKTWMEQLRQLYITRNMIDIEPRYLVGLAAGGFENLDAGTLERLRRIARYIEHQATDNMLMTFKRMPEVLRRHRLDKEYYHDGNWRDSEYGYLKVHPIIAPYDVNVIFYPQALRVMQRYAKLLKLNSSTINKLIDKWDRVKDRYRFTNSDGTTAFAIALYDVKTHADSVEYKRMEVNHTDEAYELFYGNPLEDDVVSFSQRLLDPNYFYTPSGPTIVGRHDGYSASQYHGLVTWTKQTAYVVAGLGRQIRHAERAGWSGQTIDLMRQALSVTAESSLAAFQTLQSFPELYYDDQGLPRFYSDQPEPEGIMNAVQLWSAVGARRIMRELAGLPKLAADKGFL